MKWNWQYSDWPEFIWAKEPLSGRTSQFLEQSGLLVGASQHFCRQDRLELTVELMSMEALDSSSIEGEVLDRKSVQSSIQKALGLNVAPQHNRPAESGMAEMMVDLFQSTEKPLTHEQLHSWHAMVMKGRRDINQIGDYRIDSEPMQIVSGAIYDPKIHYEAPPSYRVPKEMDAFISWFNRTSPASVDPLNPIARAGIAHLWFESIHPFEDGNGRIGRALAEKILAQGRKKPIITSLASVLLKHRKAYYNALQQASQSLNIDSWLGWFADCVLEAQARSQKYIEFLLAKIHLLDRLRGQMNARQEKVLLRMFAEGIDGFKGGLSAKNYMTITGAPSATTTRDLGDLVKKDALLRQGERKSTRYFLNLADIRH